MREAADAYPETPEARDRWIVERRPPRQVVDLGRPHGAFVERERAADGALVEVATLLLANRECRWRCLMCDLWKTTVPTRVPNGAILAQIDAGLQALELTEGADRRGALASETAGATRRQIKLYNGGSFFDAGAIPVADYPAIAARVSGFERVVVECHPALVGVRTRQFRDLLAAHGSALEVAMGLETAHPEVLAALNKRMTLDQFRGAAAWLRENGVALRVFVLVKPPFLDEPAALDWARRSIDCAVACGATVVSLIPVRAGNGAMEALERAGQFSPPRLETLEAASAYGVGLGRGRVFADLWDVERFAHCPACRAARRARLEQQNHRQVVEARVRCAGCGAGGEPA